MRMNRMIVVLIVVLGLMAGYAEAVFSADVPRVNAVLERILARKELVVGTAASMPPLNMTLTHGQIAGLEIDLAQMFASGMGVKLTIKVLPFNGLLPALEAGDIDIVLSGMTITPERNMKFAFAGPYFASGKSILARRANVELMSEVSKINNSEMVLVALRGSTSQTFAEKLFPKAKLFLTDDYDRAVSMVREKKAHAMVADFPICQVSAFRYQDSELATLKKPLSYEPLGVALPQNEFLLLNWFQNSLNSLEKSGQMSALLEKWFENGSWIKQLR